MAPEPTMSAAPAHQFRTYASDVARISGKPLQKNVKNAPAPPKPAPEPPPARVIPKAPTTNEGRDEVLARLQARAAKAPVPVPSTPAPAPIPKAPSTTEGREEVLARLRAKVSTPHTAHELPARPVSPPPEAPSVSEPRHTQRSTAAVPAPLHTYKTDFTDHATEQRAAAFSVLAAEQNAPHQPPAASPARTRSLVFIASALLFIVAGGTSIVLAYAFLTGRPVPLLGPAVPSLVFADAHQELTGDSAALTAALATLGDTLPEQQLTVAYLTYASSTKTGTVLVPAEGGTLISALALPAPSILLRNVEPESTVGAVHAGSESRPFFILRVSSYERTFAGMLSWEPTMPDALAAFYPPYPVVQDASSSPTALLSAPRHFNDEVLANHDVRVVRDLSGASLMLYGYYDPQTLIIARDEAAFKELVSRLSAH